MPEVRLRKRIVVRRATARGLLALGAAVLKGR